MDVKKPVMQFAVVAFIILGILFGMNIMTFIFGNLGPESAGLSTGDIAYNTSLAIQNQSLQAISSYASGATTQMNVLSISMVLVLLLGVFGLFWYFFMGAKKNKGSSSGASFE